MFVSGGSTFLFDRKVLRYFRKDGHNWRKKKDGKTVKEAHEKLKVGSIDMLHCYYAHGEDNENFQRRSYWLLEPDLMHIVFVHYLEVRDNHQSNSRFHSYPESPLHDDSHSALTSSYDMLSSSEYPSLRLHNLTMNQNLISVLPHDCCSKLSNEKHLFLNQENNMEGNPPGEHRDQSEQRNLQAVLTEMGIRSAVNPNLENIKDTVGNENYSFLLKKPLINSLQKDESLKKVDSFTRWMARELGEADELDMLSNNRLSWSIMGSEYDSNISAQLEVESDSLSSILGDQLFSIIDFSPSWTYSNWECKVLNDYLCSVCVGNLTQCVIELVLIHLHVHNPNIGVTDVNEGVVTVMHLYRRLEMLLCRRPSGSPIGFNEDDLEKKNLMQKIVSIMEENCHDAKLTQKNNTVWQMVTAEVLLEKQLKEKFCYWLLQRRNEEDTGPMVVDDMGQGILHLAAALGFNWVFKSIIIPGVSLDFRDVNGWTALHWAAFYGREDTVATLFSLGAAPGALTDPSAEYPLGRTPADLASSSGHKGISGFLAETSLTTHLTTLKMNDTAEDGMPDVSGTSTIHTVSERLAVLATTEEEVQDTLSLKDSLAAICNASQAAARIHQIFRIQSFQRKQFVEQGCDELLSSDERAISLVAGKSSRSGRSDGMVNAAAVHIQKKFRGWKKRKEFLQIRQKVVKIQAHVRGHQARKKHKSILWPVGILEKVILRWRRKGRGFRGFGSDGVQVGVNIQGTKSPEDNYDVLKEGRRQTEQRMQKALARVKSMAQYPEARAQYRRLLAAAEEFREAKV
ncbi:calmodulin-binding transcription activator 2 [Dorcoceras hygrometricum]|uniref:Calmodulin-binding transcription activator 2 n=1 Tax=Dorcoceras hygrometricum TaxID=472368 RepID=A0A2Z7CZF2_9LAMI|nr:calmodulin-binding transcription activator 2 [Dorcoceras hygrometricum]